MLVNKSCIFKTTLIVFFNSLTFSLTWLLLLDSNYFRIITYSEKNVSILRTKINSFDILRYNFFWNSCFGVYIKKREHQFFKLSGMHSIQIYKSTLYSIRIYNNCVKVKYFCCTSNKFHYYINWDKFLFSGSLHHLYDWAFGDWD